MSKDFKDGFEDGYHHAPKNWPADPTGLFRSTEGGEKNERYGGGYAAGENQREKDDANDRWDRFYGRK
jgi:hypothetical protein